MTSIERWTEHDSENPFLRYRELLWSYSQAIQQGWTDGRFVDVVTRLDAAVAGVAGTGFVTTPYSTQRALAEAIGVTGDLYVKDETSNVAGSHKARHLFGLAIWLEVEDRPDRSRLAIASCGNAALAAATIARGAGRAIDVYIPTWADEAVVRALSDLQAELHVCARRPGEDGDPCIHRFREAVADGSTPFGAQATDSPMTLDGGRTIGFEMISTGPVPDRVFVQVGGGALVSCVGMAFAEAQKRGRITRRPKLHPVQAEGCAPLVRAWLALESRLADDPSSALEYARHHPEEFMWPWESEPTSLATGILDDVTYDWLAVVEQTAGSGGEPVLVGEPVIAEAHTLARSNTDVPVDPTGTAGLAGLMQWVEGQRPATGSECLAVLFTGRDRSLPASDMD